ASSSGQLTCSAGIRHTTGYVLARTNDVTEAADQLAHILTAHREVVILADEPAQDSRRGVGPVFAVTAQAPVIGGGDLGLDLRTAGWSASYLVGHWRDGGLPEGPGPGAD